MKYPSFTKRNMRYRGPMESKKFNEQYRQVHHDLTVLYKSLDALKEETKAFYSEHRKDVAEMSAEQKRFQDDVSCLRGGEKYV